MPGLRSPCMNEIADPRCFPDAAAADAGGARVHALAAAVLAAGNGPEAEASQAALDAMLDAALDAAPPEAAGRTLDGWLASAPSLDLRRALWRALLRRVAVPASGGVAAQLFAMPLVLVAGVAGSGEARAMLSGVLPDPAALCAVLLEHRGLGGNRAFTLAPVLATADALDVAAQPTLRAARAAAERGAPLPLAAAPCALPGGESVHLRFLVGSALSAPGVDVVREATTGAWGLPLTRALAAQLAAPGVTLLALPRPAAAPLAAVALGRAAQRDVAAQLFASNAIRELRARYGEPAAVLSAHRAADASDGGELRLSLSSRFSPRDAYGHRCPILPHERAGDVAAALLDLLSDARVTDVTVVPGVHGDRDPVTGGPLLFKPGTLPGASPVH